MSIKGSACDQQRKQYRPQAADSTPCRAWIPRDVGPVFHGVAGHRSTAVRTLIITPPAPAAAASTTATHDNVRGAGYFT